MGVFTGVAPLLPQVVADGDGWQALEDARAIREDPAAIELRIHSDQGREVWTLPGRHARPLGFCSDDARVYACRLLEDQRGADCELTIYGRETTVTLATISSGRPAAVSPACDAVVQDATVWRDGKTTTLSGSARFVPEAFDWSEVGLTAADGRLVRVYDTETLEQRWSAVPPFSARHTALAWHDGLLAAGTERGLYVIDRVGAERLVNDATIEGLRWTPEGVLTWGAGRILHHHLDGATSLWPVTPSVADAHLHEGEVRGHLVRGDGFIIRGGGAPRVHSYATEMVRPVHHDNIAIVPSPDRTALFRIDTQEQYADLPGRYMPGGVAGDRIITFVGTVPHVFTLQTGERFATLPLENLRWTVTGYGLVGTPIQSPMGFVSRRRPLMVRLDLETGALTAFTIEVDNGVAQVRTEDGELLYRFRTPKPVWYASLSPDAEQLLIQTVSNTWRMERGEPGRSRDRHIAFGTAFQWGAYGPRPFWDGELRFRYPRRDRQSRKRQTRLVTMPRADAGFLVGGPTRLTWFDGEGRLTDQQPQPASVSSLFDTGTGVVVGFDQGEVHIQERGGATHWFARRAADRGLPIDRVEAVGGDDDRVAAIAGDLLRVWDRSTKEELWQLQLPPMEVRWIEVGESIELVTDDGRRHRVEEDRGITGRSEPAVRPFTLDPERERHRVPGGWEWTDRAEVRRYAQDGTLLGVSWLLGDGWVTWNDGSFVGEGLLPDWE